MVIHIEREPLGKGETNKLLIKWNTWKTDSHYKVFNIFQKEMNVDFLFKYCNWFKE